MNDILLWNCHHSAWARHQAWCIGGLPRDSIVGSLWINQTHAHSPATPIPVHRPCWEDGWLEPETNWTRAQTQTTVLNSCGSYWSVLASLKYGFTKSMAVIGCLHIEICIPICIFLTMSTCPRSFTDISQQDKVIMNRKLSINLYY